MVNTSDKIILSVLVLLLVVASTAFISAGNIFGENDARKVALGNVKGDVLEVEVEGESGSISYEVDVLSEDGVREVRIDEQGNVLSIEKEEEDVPITGNALELASQAALDYIGEGRVTDSEIGDEEGYYEIEITLDSGGEVDVHLDENFNILSIEYD